MKGKNISEILAEFLPMLEIENWLEKVGNFSSEEIFAPFEVKNITDPSKIKESIMSADFENLDLEVRNELFAFSDNQIRDLDINLLSEAVRDEFFKKRSYLEQKLRAKNLPTEIFDYVLLGIVMGAFMEFYIQREKPKMPIDFNRNLLKILNLGYLPCGWEPKKSSETALYNPLTFIEDSLLQTQNKKVKPFDYQSGILFVW